jgi:hypothetical protein
MNILHVDGDMLTMKAEDVPDAVNAVFWLLISNMTRRILRQF